MGGEQLGKQNEQAEQRITSWTIRKRFLVECGCGQGRAACLFRQGVAGEGRAGGAGGWGMAANTAQFPSSQMSSPAVSSRKGEWAQFSHPVAAEAAGCTQVPLENLLPVGRRQAVGQQKQSRGGQQGQQA